jgi:hypothetical protein
MPEGRLACPSQAVNGDPQPAPLSAATQPATVAISAVRSADAGRGTGCRQVDTDSNACTPQAYEPARPITRRGYPVRRAAK